ncbi:diuretic hormone 44 [Neodiprion virginianus]|uniref:diuretic hormone 44 n=1 Tax=Neodiprion fabricii TaxID=2872261 RepID=UPI001ED973C5|nr:diuretic hormone 44 [Neodiprion fabricii]XP_046409920.1 diuretic hormone 44 [Neodiprion fabricii]XP_046605654.1 diuretic hormone 44 [Neodiprion virginianus]XP_046605655.1 diuretic hormone 44 [Neodiprion virginianus]
MFLVNFLAAASVIGIVQSAPTSTYRRRDELADRPELLLFNQIHALEEADLGESDSGRSVGAARIKRLGSLSIVNPLDVLRERVILELTRRKMRQNQKQVDANRRIMQSIGKRAITDAVQLNSNEDSDPAGFMSSKADDFLYSYRIPETDLAPEDRSGQQHRQHLASDRGTERQQAWEALQESESDQTRRMGSELSLL